MAIKVAPIFSEPLYLGDLSEEVAKMEKDCDQNDRAWIKARQATESDEMEISSLYSKSKTVWTGEATEQVQEINPRERQAMEIYLCMVDAGNIDDEDGPLFTFVENGPYAKVDGGFQIFKEAYGRLPSEATLAMLRAVYTVNPGWGWWLSQEKSEGEAKTGE